MSSQYKVTLGANVLCDDAANPKITGVTQTLSGQGSVQIEDCYNSAYPFERPQGNARGQFVFTAGCSFSSYANAAAAWAAAYALIDTQASCVWIYGASTNTMLNAILRNVERVKWDGVYLLIRYTIEFTTFSTA